MMGSFWIISALNPMTNVLIRERQREIWDGREGTQRGEGEVNMEEEIGVRWPEASEGQRMPAASCVGRSNEQIFP